MDLKSYAEASGKAYKALYNKATAYRVAVVSHVGIAAIRDSWRIEEGKHAAQSGMDLKSYAERAGKKYTTLYDKAKAYRVLTVTHVRNDQARDSWRNLAEIHAAPKWLWRAMVETMLHNSWTVAVTREPTVPHPADSQPPPR